MADDEEDIDYDFASKTSMHGIQRLAEKRHASYKIFWLIIIIAAVVFCTWEVLNRIDDFSEHNVNTEISFKYPNSLTFPAVTVCNFNRYKKSKLTENDYFYISCSLYFLNLKSFEYTLDSEGDEEFCKEWITISGFNSSELTQRAGFDLDTETLLFCKFRNIPCDSRNFTSVITDYGRCWTFNGDSKNPHKQFLAGYNNGLRMMINVNQKEYSESLKVEYISMDAGLRVIVHAQHSSPAVYSAGFAIGTGMHAYVDVSVTEYDNLDSPHGDCKKDQQLEYYATYSYDNCLSECMTNYYVYKCECRPEKFNATHRICDVKDYHCQIEAENYIKSGSLDCSQCFLECKDIKYDSKISYANFPSYSIGNDTEDVLNMSAQYIKENVVLLNVYFSALSKQYYKQTEAMTSSALLSDIGGQLGLFIGVSFITVIEITEYLIKKAMDCCTQSGKRKTKKKNHRGTANDKTDNLGYVSNTVSKM